MHRITFIFSSDEKKHNHPRMKELHGTDIGNDIAAGYQFEIEGQ